MRLRSLLLIILALVAGLAWSGSGFPLPRMLDTFTGMLSGAATPCALFALGTSLAAYRIDADPGSTFAMVGFKLIVHPVVVWLLASFVFHLDPKDQNTLFVGSHSGGVYVVPRGAESSANERR